jgi:hypothetical protein
MAYRNALSASRNERSGPSGLPWTGRTSPRMDDPSTGSLTDLQFDDQNANQGTPRGMGALESSLKRLGLGRSILVDRDNRIIAGNKTAEKAGEQGVAQKVRFIDTDGTELIAVRRTDLSLDDPQARELAIADNRVAELNLEWDPEVLSALAEVGDLDAYFTTEELQELTLTPTEEVNKDEDPTPGDMANTTQESENAGRTCPHCGEPV